MSIGCKSGRRRNVADRLLVRRWSCLVHARAVAYGSRNYYNTACSLQCSCCTSHQVNTRRGWQPTRSPERDAGRWLTRSADLQAAAQQAIRCMWTVVRKQCRKKYYDLGSEFFTTILRISRVAVNHSTNQPSHTYSVPWRCLNVISFLVISNGTCWRIDAQNYQWRLQRFTGNQLWMSSLGTISFLTCLFKVV